MPAEEIAIYGYRGFRCFNARGELVTEGVRAAVGQDHHVHTHHTTQYKPRVQRALC